MLEDFDLKVNLMMELMRPDKPFTNFIGAYIRNRLPIFSAFFQSTAQRFATLRHKLPPPRPRHRTPARR